MPATVSYLSATIAGSCLLPFIDVLNARGIASGSLLLAHQLPASLAQHPERHWPLTAVADFLLAAQALMPDERLGLAAGEAMHPAQWGPVWSLMMYSATLGDALANTVRYEPLVNPALITHWQSRGERTVHVSSYSGCPEHERLAVLLEFDFASLLRCARFLHHLPGSHGMEFLAVRFRHAQPADGLSHYRRVLGHEPLFLQADNAVEYPATALSLAVATADAAQARLLRYQLDQSLALWQGGWLEDVRKQIRQRLSDGEVTREQLAAFMQISVSTLQRRLQAQGISFRELYRQVREQEACTALQNPLLSLQEITFRLGFANASAFCHAFRQWTGQTPGEYRRQWQFCPA